MLRIAKSLSVRLTFCIVICTVVVLWIMSFYNIRLYRNELRKTSSLNAESISESVKRSTRYSMLTNNRQELYHIIEALGDHPYIKKIRIFNKEGNIKFSTDVTEVDAFVDKNAEACYACHAKEKPLVKLDRPDRTREFRSASDERLLGFIFPIANEPDCYNAPCHAHPESATVLGVLDVVICMKRADASIAASEKFFVLSGILTIIVISIASGFLVWLLVHVPVKKLIRGTENLAKGNLDYRIDINRGDEIGYLAISFNRMTADLKKARDEVRSWTKKLEQRVELKKKKLEIAQKQVIHSERMASIGKLAAIVAHEINNPLAGIYTYSKLLIKQVKKTGLPDKTLSSLIDPLSIIETESARCGEIVKQLLQFSRQSDLNLHLNDINKIIEQSIKLVQHKIDLMNITTDIELETGLPEFVCDAQQVKQALIAIFINAFEAMKEGGKLTVRSTLDRTHNVIKINILDSGMGMDEETKSHIFEPFFSTKDEGQGVGLGLAVVYGIIKNHKGDISVYSEPGHGTAFTITFPVDEAGDDVVTTDL